MTDEKKELKTSELNEEVNKVTEKSDKTERKNDKKAINKVIENPTQILSDAGIKYVGSEIGAQAIFNTMVKKEEKEEVKSEKPQKEETKKEEFSKSETPKQEVRVESNPKKKGKVISIGKASIVVRGEKGEGIRLFGYKNVKIGDTVLY